MKSSEKRDLSDWIWSGCFCCCLLTRCNGFSTILSYYHMTNRIPLYCMCGVSVFFYKYICIELSQTLVKRTIKTKRQQNKYNDENANLNESLWSGICMWVIAAAAAKESERARERKSECSVPLLLLKAHFQKLSYTFMDFLERRQCRKWSNWNQLCCSSNCNSHFLAFILHRICNGDVCVCAVAVARAQFYHTLYILNNEKALFIVQHRRVFTLTWYVRIAEQKNNNNDSDNITFEKANYVYCYFVYSHSGSDGIHVWSVGYVLLSPREIPTNAFNFFLSQKCLHVFNRNIPSASCISKCKHKTPHRPLNVKSTFVSSSIGKCAVNLDWIGADEFVHCKKMWMQI